jgi:DNA-binding NarL/FixJ family response regulator
VAVVHAQPLVRLGLRAALPAEAFTIVAEAGTLERAEADVRAWRPEVVLLDPQLPGVTGVEACRRVRRAAPRAAVVVLSPRADAVSVHTALAAGARGYVVTTGEHAVDLAALLRLAAAGRLALDGPAAAALGAARAPAAPPPEPLSEREREVLALVVAGLTNAQIGRRLFLSRHTVKEYLSTAMRKLGVTTRVEAALAATRLGLLEPLAERRSPFGGLPPEGRAVTLATGARRG